MSLWTFDVWEDVWEDFRARTLLPGRPSGPANRTALSVRLSYQLFDSENPDYVHIKNQIFGKNWPKFPGKKSKAWEQWSDQKRSVGCNVKAQRARQTELFPRDQPRGVPEIERREGSLQQRGPVRCLLRVFWSAFARVIALAESKCLKMTNTKCLRNELDLKLTESYSTGLENSFVDRGISLSKSIV